ncbi:MAG: hypothetical protein LPK80_07545 [Bacteroidota bacterium]|nr:hypothetical protein [Bacteroidota bacterium]MDX5405390.1 hypothetical protein [Bacteroidota bacterium]MDX5448980.1 hypothetical protein [Bacteroidota bacterium]
MPRRKLFTMVGIVGALIAIGVFLFMWFKPHRDIHNELEVFNGTATELYSELQNDPDGFKLKYVDQPIVVSGEVVSKESSIFTISPNHLCQLDSTLSMDIIVEGAPISVKGRLVGIEEDELMGDLLIRIDHVRPQ